MAPVLEVSGGGAFLIRSLNSDDLFTPEDLSDEQRLFGRTAAEFMRNEVQPHEASLYAHDWTTTRELLKKAADLDLLRLEIPEAYGGLGLDKVSAAYVGGAGRYQSVVRRFTGDTHIDRHLADCLFRNARAESQVSAPSRQR